MNETELDVVCIGNAIVDVLARCEDSDIERLHLERGAMTLIDAERATWLYDHMGPAIESSGGSAANTAAGIASLGGRVAYIGKVADDDLGRIFRHDIEAIGVGFRTSAASGGAPTARCLIFITPDAQRTMNTFLGACVDLGPGDIDTELIANAKVTYLEGYLWDPPAAKEAFLAAARAAQEADRLVALTLSDAFCVGRHRASFLDLIRGHVDILFANETEIESLYEVESFDAALQHVREDCKIAALTRGPKGSVIVAGDEVHVIDPEPVERVIDTTGAGDLYAAGFLYGLTHGEPLERCARLGSLAAAEVISHIGPRPDVSLAEIARSRLPA